MDKPLKGRASVINPAGRFETRNTENFDDGWHQVPIEKIRTEIFKDNTRRIISYNKSPDIPFDRSINPYRGCEHGCIYCYARPSHSWLNLSPGLDFESKLFYKDKVVELLRNELCAPNYTCAPIALGVNTDAYQPIERQHKITRQTLALLLDAKHPVTLITKSALIERDIDILIELARHQLVHTAISVTTLDAPLARRMEPRAATPHRRLKTVNFLAAHKIPVSVMVAPVIPALNDHEMETILQQAKAHGAKSAHYVTLRLPYEVNELFQAWLHQHFPAKANHVMNILRDMRNQQNNDSRFGTRMRGEGVFAELLNKRFNQQIRRLNFPGTPPLRCDLFSVKNIQKQMSLF